MSTINDTNIKRIVIDIHDHTDLMVVIFTDVYILKIRTKDLSNAIRVILHNIIRENEDWYRFLYQIKDTPCRLEIDNGNVIRIGHPDHDRWLDVGEI